MDIPAPEQVRILTALGFARRRRRRARRRPSWRPDVQGEADLVEEIARVASLAGLEGAPLTRPAGVARPILTPMQRREGQARRRIAALGYNECVTYSFIDRAAAALFGGGSDAVRLENPISSEMSHLRPDLLPGPAARRRPQPGARLRRPRALRDRRRSSPAASPASSGCWRPACASAPPARATRSAPAARSTSRTPAPTPRPRSPPSARPRR